MRGFVVFCSLAFVLVSAANTEQGPNACIDQKCHRRRKAEDLKKLPESQPSVFSPTKEHALYMTIYITQKADAKACAKSAAKLQTYVDAVSPPDVTPEAKKIIAGVGFGQAFYKKIGHKAVLEYTYKDRSGHLGPLPATGGDIFIHAKSDSVSKLFELAQKILEELPEHGCMESFEDIYSFVYKDGRDLSGFTDGTENPSTESWRQSVAVENSTGGSYVVTQRWIHNMHLIAESKVSTLEQWIGRTMKDSAELKNKTATCHVAAMVGGPEYNKPKPFQIVRQSMPYGNLHSKAGLFFIAYAASPENFEFMLRGMTGRQTDDVMRISEAVSGQYWYFPSVKELSQV